MAVWNAATAAIDTLQELGYKPCFVGGVACALHGNSRTPKDLDILILDTNDSQEEIKRRITYRNPSFYLINGKKPGATYKVLWYRSSTYTTIKVDILKPGIMDIPDFSASQISRSNTKNLPVAPLSITLLLKLQAWSDHRNNPELYFSKEQYKDKTDLECLVPIAAGKGVKPKSDRILDSTFVEAAQKRVLEYLKADFTGSTREGWKTMGFQVPSSGSTTRSSYSSSSYSTYSTSPISTYPRSSTSTSSSLQTTSRYRVKPAARVQPLYRRSNFTFDY